MGRALQAQRQDATRVPLLSRAHGAGKLFTGLFKRNLLKLTDFISRGRNPRESRGIIH